MSKKIIKCSQCDKEFYTGTDYRKHWEHVHLKKFLENESL